MYLYKKIGGEIMAVPISARKKYVTAFFKNV
jgi:hypothetical protein